MPGGFFRWAFYWDSGFVVPGLLLSGETALAREVVENLIASIERGFSWTNSVLLLLVARVLFDADGQRRATTAHSADQP